MWEEIGSFSYLDVQMGKKSGFFLLTSASGAKGSIATFCPPVYAPAYTFVVTATTAL